RIPKSLDANSDRLRTVALTPPARDKGKCSRASTRHGPTFSMAELSPRSPSQPVKTSTRDCSDKRDPQSQRKGRSQSANSSASWKFLELLLPAIPTRAPADSS